MNIKILHLMLALMTLNTFIIKCQTNKGSFLVGGDSNLDLKNENSEARMFNDLYETNDFIFQFSPQIAYFLVNRLAVGLEIPVSYLSRKYNDENLEDKTELYLAFSPLIKYYFGSKSIKPFLHGQIGYGIVKTKNYYSNNYPLFLYEIKGGMALFLNEKIAIESSIGYEFESHIYKNDSNNFRRISGELGLSIGIIAFFNLKE